jgi:hypothetical protein
VHFEPGEHARNHNVLRARLVNDLRSEI